MTKELEAARAKAAADAEKKEAARIAAEQAKDLKDEVKPSAELAAAAEKESTKLAELDDPDINEGAVGTAARPEYDAAARKLRIIAMSYPQTTPNEHPIFGFAGHVFRLGELRDLVGLPKL